MALAIHRRIVSVTGSSSSAAIRSTSCRIFGLAATVSLSENLRFPAIETSVIMYLTPRRQVHNHRSF